MIKLVSDRVWDGLGSITLKHPIRAAIAYVGRDAPIILALDAGDQLVVDGSDAALTMGSTHPDALATYLAAGVDIVSLPGLHAKVIATGGRKPLAIVGSANASRHAKDRLHEAALITDDRTVVEGVALQIQLWFGDPTGTVVDQAWIDHARSIYRPNPLPPPRRTNKRATSGARRLWVGRAIPGDTPMSRATTALVASLVRRHKELEVSPWGLNRGDEPKLRVGDDVLLFESAAEEAPVHGNKVSTAPARVTRLVPPSVRHKPMAILIHDPRGPRVTFAELKRVITSAGGELEYENPMISPVALAVREALDREPRRKSVP